MMVAGTWISQLHWKSNETGRAIPPTSLRSATSLCTREAFLTTGADDPGDPHSHQTCAQKRRLIEPPFALNCVDFVGDGVLDVPCRIRRSHCRSRANSSCIFIDHCSIASSRLPETASARCLISSMAAICFWHHFLLPLPSETRHLPVSAYFSGEKCRKESA